MFNLSLRQANAAIILIILIGVLLSVYSIMIPEAQQAGDLFNTSNQCNARGCFYNWTTDVCQFDAANASKGFCIFPSNVPFAQSFSSTGIVFAVVMAGLFLIILKSLFFGKNGK